MGALIEETIWLGDTPVATLRPGTPVGIFYVHTDHLNTPRKVTRPSDNQARWTWESDPFGTAAPNENPQSLGTFQYNLRFPGQIYDAHTGLNYNYYRDYDPAIGRYVESDPIGLAGGASTYAYVASNPVSYFDPDGQEYRAPGELGHGEVINHGARVGGYIVDLPDTPRPRGYIGKPPPLSDVDFFYVNCTLYKIKHGTVHLYAHPSSPNRTVILADPWQGFGSKGAIWYPASEQPWIFDMVDKLKPGEVEGPVGYLNSTRFDGIGLPGRPGDPSGFGSCDQCGN